MTNEKNNFKHIFSNWIAGVSSNKSFDELPQSDSGRLDLQSLEDRVLYSAGPLPIDLTPSVEVVDAVSGSADLIDSIDSQFELLADSFDAFQDEYWVESSIESEVVSPIFEDSQTIEIVVVDQSVDNYQVLVDDLLSLQTASRQFEVIYLSANEDGVRQISQQISERRGINAVHLVTHGQDGELRLGNSTINLESINSFSDEISGWKKSLAENADILIYGCDVAETQLGEDFVDQLSELLEADVAASDDTTGHESLGGDWYFEYHVGAVETDVAFSTELIADWKSILPAAPTSPTAGELLSDNDSTSRAVAADYVGNIFIVSSSDVVVGSVGKDIYLTARDTSNADIFTNQLVNSTLTAGAQDEAVIAMADSGDYVVVWTSDAGGSDNIFAKVYDSDGGVERDTFQVNELGTTASDASVSMNANGEFVIAWEGSGSADSDGVYARKFNEQGEELSGILSVNTTTTGFQGNADVAINDNGIFIVSWDVADTPTTGGGIFVSIFDADSEVGIVESSFVSTTAVSNYQSSVAIDNALNVVVTATAKPTQAFINLGATDNSDIIAATIDQASLAPLWRSGTAIDNASLTNFNVHPPGDANGFQYRSSVAIFDGQMVVTWEGEASDSVNPDSDYTSVYRKTMDFDGTNPSAEIMAGGTLADIQETPSIVSFHDGEAWAMIWKDENGASTIIDQSRSQSYTNTLPTGQSLTRNVDEGGTRVLSVADFGYADAEQTLGEVEINSLPSLGILLLGGIQVEATDEISGQDIIDGNLVYLSNENSHGTDSFSFTVNDGYADAASPNTLTLNFQDVADGANVTAGNKLVSIDGPSLVNETVIGNQQDQAVAGLAGGGYVVVYRNDVDGEIYHQIYDASGAKSGEQVVYASIDEKNEPAVVGLNDGGFVVAWTDEESGLSPDIFLQRFNAAGVAVEISGVDSGSATPTVWGRMADHEYSASLTALSDGGFVLTYTANNPYGTGTGSDILGVIYSASGENSGEFLIHDTIAGEQREPEVAALGNNSFVVAWVDQSVNAYDVRARVFDAGDSESGVEFALNTLTAERQSKLAITGLANGNFVATWDTTGAVDGGGRGVYGAVFDKDGNRLTDPAADILINETTLNHQNDSTLVALDDGGFVALWESANNVDGVAIVGTRFDANGDPVDSANREFVLATHRYGDQFSPEAALLKSGDIVVTWAEADGDNGGSGFGSGVFVDRFRFAATGAEDTSIPLHLDIRLTDSTESFSSIVISGIPAGAIISDDAGNATAVGDSSVSITASWDIGSLKITPPADSYEDFHLNVDTVSDGNQNGTNVSDQFELAVIVDTQVDSIEKANFTLSTDKGVQLTITTNELLSGVDNPDLATTTVQPNTSFSHAQLPPTDSAGELEWSDDSNGSAIVFEAGATYIPDAGSDIAEITGAIYLDGTVGGTIPASAFNSISSNAVIETWIKPDSLASESVLLDWGGSGGGVSLFQEGSTVLLKFHLPKTIDEGNGPETTTPYVLIADGLSSTEFNKISIVFSWGTTTTLGDTGATPDVQLFLNGELKDQILDVPNYVGGEFAGVSNDAGIGKRNFNIVGDDVKYGNFVGEIAKFDIYGDANFVASEEVESRYQKAVAEPSIASIEGQSTDPATITLASGAQLTINGNDTFDYDPGSVYDYLRAGESAFDTFEYEIVNGFGQTDTVEVTVEIVGNGNLIPIDLNSGVELNDDGGNSAFFVAQDGDVFGGLDEFTLEIMFASDNPNAAALVSYQSTDQPDGAGAYYDDFLIMYNGDGTLSVSLPGGGATPTIAFASGIDYSFLVDGSLHNLGFTWNSVDGSWGIFVDGVLTDFGTGAAVGESIPAGGELVFGQEQDVPGGQFDSSVAFKGTYHDVRIWDEVRSSSEISGGHDSKLDPLASVANLVADWQFNELSGAGSDTVVNTRDPANSLSLSGSANDSLRVDETAGNGTVVGNVLPTDIDGDDNYSFSMVSSNSAYSIDVNGQITISDASAISFETAASNTLEVTVDSDGGSFDKFLTVEVINVNEQVVLDLNQGISIAVGSSDNVITSSLLAASDEDTSDGAANLTYTVTSATTRGSLLLNNAALGVNGTFTQNDINSGLLKYDHGGSPNPDAFSFSLADGGEDGTTPVTGTFTIGVGGLNQAPQIATNTGVTIAEGTASTVITKWMLDEGDPDDNVNQVTYTITAAPAEGILRLDGNAIGINATFTQQQINSGGLTYEHSGGEASSDSFEFELADGGEDGVSPAVGTFNITVTPINDAPTVGVNDGLTLDEGETETLTNTMLAEGDPDDTGVGLTYTITDAVDHGVLRLGASVLDLGDTFNQTNINSGAITYEHLGGEISSDAFSFDLADGGEDLPVGYNVSDTFAISVNSINDEPTVLVNTGSAVDEGGSQTITTAMLRGIDPDNTDAELEFEITSDFAEGEIRLNGTAIGLGDTFTQDDIDANLVVYHHNGSETTNVSFDFSLTDNVAGTTPATGTFAFTVNPVNDSPTVATNTGITVDEGDVGSVITSAMLSEGDPDDSGVGLVYEIKTAVANGTLLLDSATLTVGSTFTQADIDAGRLSYTHLGGENTSDSFEFELRDGGEDSAVAVTQTFNVTVQPINDSPSIATNTGVTVSEGQQGVVIAQTMLNEGDPDDSGVGLTYKITSDVSNGTITLNDVGIGNGDTFTQEDINLGRVKYSHNGSETTTDSFAFSLVDGGEDGAVGVLSTFDITVTPVNDAPTVAVNTGLAVDEGILGNQITNAMLREGDPDDSGVGSIYEVTTATTNGVLRLDGTALGLTDTFTQADIINGLLTYDHSGGENTSDSFEFELRDGGEDGSTPATGTFNITVTPVNDAPTVAVNTGRTVVENSTTNTITTAMLNEGDPDDAGAELTYTITTEPTLGVLRLNGVQLNRLDTFLQSDIDASIVTYDHHGDTSAPDSFEFSLSDGGENGAGAATGSFVFTVTGVNDSPTVSINTGLTAAEGSTSNVITDSMLGEGDPDDDGADLVYTITTDVAHGALILDGTAIGLSSTFTAADITAGLLVYSHGGSETLSDSFEFELADGGEDGATVFNSTFGVVITPVNDSPQLGSNTGRNALENSTGNLITSSMLNEADPDDSLGELTYTLDSIPSEGTLRLSGAALNVGDTFTQDDIDNELVTYDHGGSLNTADSFDFTLRDGGENGSVAVSDTFAFTINQTNEAPVANDDVFGVAKGGWVTIGVERGLLYNDTDADGDTLSVISTTDGTYGSVVFASNGEFTYTQDGGESSSDTFTYTVTDGNGEFATATVTVHIDDNGFIATSEFRVNNDSTDSPLSESQTTAHENSTFSESAVASTADGDYVVVWTGADAAGNESVFAQRYDFSGTQIGSAIDVSSGLSTGDNRSASVAMDDAGNFVVAWTNRAGTTASADGTPSSVYFQRFDSSGERVGTAELASSGGFSVGAQVNPDVSMNANGRFAITWDGENTGGISQDVYINIFANDGTPLTGGPETVNVGGGSVFDYNTSVTVADDGSAYVFWDDGPNLHAKYFDSLGNGGSEFVVPSDSDAIQTRHASLDFDSDRGILAVAYEVQILVGGIDLQWETRVQVTEVGSLTSVSLPLGNQTLAGDQQNTSVSFGDDGSLLMTWDGNGVDDVRGIFGRHFLVDVNGDGDLYAQPAGDEFLINQAVAGIQQGASVAALDSENFVVVWSGGGSGDSDGIFARQYGNQTGYALTGQVLEDIDGNADLSDAQAFAGATVYLYLNDSDSAISAGDQRVRTTVTDSLGGYTFEGLKQGSEYFVVVDSSTVQRATYKSGFSDADVWAEQTFGDGGAKFSGLTGDRSDDATSLLTSEHVSAVSIGDTDLSGVDFGFSFNVVTNSLGGGDDNDDGSIDGPVQGSVRQFIQNANAIDGDNHMRFVPVTSADYVDGASSYWEIAVQDALPEISDEGTFIDGRAYASDGLTRVNYNSETLGYQGAVGVGADGVAGTGDELELAGVDAPELEITDLNGVGIGLHVTASDVEIAYIAIQGFGDSNAVSGNIIIQGESVSGVYIHDNVIGAKADSFVAPSTALQSTLGIGVSQADDGIIANNLIGFTEKGGLRFHGGDGANGWEIVGNEIRSAGLPDKGRDGIDILNGSSNTLISGNLIEGNYGFGVDSYRSAGGNEIVNNTITGNGIGTREKGGVRLYGSDNSVQSNLISGNTGVGVHVIGEYDNGSEVTEASTGNLISKNSFELNSGIAIDLSAATTLAETHRNGDGYNSNDDVFDPTTGNQGVDHPTLTTAYITDEGLHITGLLPVSQNVEYVEVYLASADLGETHGEGKQYLGSLDGSNLVSYDDSTGAFESLLAIPVGGWPQELIDGSGAITAIVIADNNNTSEFGNNEQVNVAPEALGSVVNATEDLPYEFSVDNFKYGDPNGTEYFAIRVVDLPTEGALLFDGDKVLGGETIRRTAIDAGRLVYAANPNQNGLSHDQFTFRVFDGQLGSTNVATLNINVAAVNDAPNLVADAYSVDEDQTLTVSAAAGLLVNDSDVDVGDALTVNTAPIVAPTNGTVEIQADGSFVYVPNENFSGTDTFEYEVSDGSVTRTEVVNLTVIPVNDNPEFVSSASVTFDEGSTDVIVISATDVENETVTYELTGDGEDNSLFTLDPDTGQLVFDVLPDYESPSDSDSDRVYVIEVRAVDTSGGETISEVRIEILNVSESPQIDFTDPIEVDENVVEIGRIEVSDPEGGELVYEIAGGDDASRFTIDSSTGELAFVEARDYENRGSASGSNVYMVVVQVGDSDGNSASQLISVHVNDVNEAPVAENDFYWVDESGSFILDVESNDIDPESGLLTVSIVDAPEHGTIEVNGDGSLTYVHDGSETNSDSFTYRVTDADGESDTASAAISVNSVDDVTQAVDDVIVVDSAGEIIIDPSTILSNDIDPDSLKTDMRVVPVSAENGAVEIVDGKLVFTPAPDSRGASASFQYVIEIDGVVGGDVGTVNLIGAAPLVVNTQVESETVETVEESESTEESAVEDGESSSTAGPGAGTQANEGQDVVTPIIGGGRPGNVEQFANTQSGDGVVQENLLGESNTQFGELNSSYSYSGRGESLTLVSLVTAATTRSAEELSEFETTLLAALAWDRLDEAKRDFIISNIEIGMPQFVASAASMLTVGYLGWIIRGGVLLTTFMSSVPAWSSFDITSIIESATGDESIEQMVDQ